VSVRCDSAKSSYSSQMKSASLTNVKNELSRYVEQVRRGERIRILLRGQPVAELVPIEQWRESEWSEDDLIDLERAGVVRRGRALTRNEQRLVEAKGPSVRAGRAVEMLLAERRRGR
jgi:prevent-host-death family protein